MYIPKCMSRQSFSFIFQEILKLQHYKKAVTERSICKGNKLQALIKAGVIYKWSNVQTRNLYHRVCHELRNGLLGKFFLLLLCITTNKVEDYWLQITTLISRELTAIAYNSFGALPSNQDFELLMLRQMH